MMETISLSQNTRVSKRTPSTFLLTDALARQLLKLLRQRKLSFPQYFTYLCREYGPRIRAGKFSMNQSAKRRYQCNQMQYTPKSFRPHNDDWIEFSQLATYLNWSKCYLFATLLRLDLNIKEKISWVYKKMRGFLIRNDPECYVYTEVLCPSGKELKKVIFKSVKPP